MFRITNILNPLTGKSETEKYKRVDGKALSDYIGYEGYCLITCNGNTVDLPITDVYPANGEDYVIIIIPEGGDRQTWRVIGQLTMGAVSMIPGWGWAVAAVGGYLLYTLLQDKPKNISTSQSYSWRHTDSPTAAQGGAMPVIYGKVRMRPTLKNRYITVEGDKQRLYALYGLAAHKVDERSIGVWSDKSFAVGEEVIPDPASLEPGKTYIYINRMGQRRDAPVMLGEKEWWKTGHGTAKFADHIIVNGRTITDYYDDVDWDTRPGLPQQAIIEDFNLTYTNFAQDESLYIDAIAPDWKRADIRYSPNAGRLLSWNRHTMYFHGEAFIIEKDSTFLPTVTKCYLYFDASISPTQYLIRSDGSVPSGYDGIVATIDTGTDELIRYSTGVPDDTTWFKPIATLTGAHNIELIFDFPYGLAGQSSTGGLVRATCRLFAQYKKFDSDTWLNFDFPSINRPRGVVFDPPIEYGTITAGIIKRKTAKSFSISVRAVPFLDVLDPEETYQIRICADAPTIVKLVNVATIVYGEKNTDGTRPGFTYPGEPLLGIKALASGQISGDLDVQVDVERSLVWVRDTFGWVRRPANNHAWAVYDKFAQGHPDHPAYPIYGNENAEAIYGCGIDYRRIDFASFEKWADNITALGYELNIVFDTFMTAWDAILRICQEGRGMVYPVGTKIYAFTDKAEDVSQIFTMGNIQMDTFVQKFMESSKKANMIEATYWDAERNYEETMLAARTADWDSSQDLNTPISVKLYGTTTFNQAWSIARYLLMGNELLNNVTSFGVDVDALAVQAGQVVEVQHDVLTTGQGGRITAVTGNPTTGYTITFDRTLTLVAGQIYELKIYHKNGYIDTQYGITGGVPTTQIVFGPDWHFLFAPAEYELYSFGIRNAHVNKYRVVEISRTNELMRTLILMQYDETMYDGYIPSDEDSAIGAGTVSAAKVMVSPDSVGVIANLLNLASNLKLQEILSKNRVTGEYESSVVATWDTVAGDPRGTWEIWFRDVDESDIDWKGTWDEDGTYETGDKVERNGKTYISLEDNNVSQPLSLEDIGRQFLP